MAAASLENHGATIGPPGTGTGTAAAASLETIWEPETWRLEPGEQEDGAADLDSLPQSWGKSDLFHIFQNLQFPCSSSMHHFALIVMSMKMSLPF